MHPDLIETEADSCSRKPGDIAPGAHDEYEVLCDYAGCYPWLGECAHLNPHDDALSICIAVDEVDPFAG